MKLSNKPIGEHTNLFTDDIEIVESEMFAIINKLTQNISLLNDKYQILEARHQMLENKIEKFVQSEKKICIACWEYESAFALQPCGHKLLCGNCAATLMNSNPTCPFCRTRVTDIIQIHDVAIPANNLPTLPTNIN